MSTPSARAKVFISYSHHDTPWLKEFQRMLKPVVDAGVLDLWSDQRIATGSDWRREIVEALDSARVALLLVSNYFLESDFITQYELPGVLESARERGLSIIWVPVSSCLYESTPLKDIQAALDPKAPLDSLAPPGSPASTTAIRNICQDLCARLGQVSRVDPTERNLLRDAAQRRMPPGLTLGELVASGSSSVLFRATRDDDFPLAVKVLVESPRHQRPTAEVAEQARLATHLKHPVFIKIHQALLKERPYALISEYVDNAETLSHALESGPFVVDRVVSILQQLCEALAEAGQRGLVYGFIKASNILLQDHVSPRLSPFGFWTYLVKDADLAGNFVVNREMLSYMTPEYFYGWPVTILADQYALGQIALQMLEGSPRVTVRHPADLLAKEKFFEDPFATPPTWARRHPGLAHILRRMLARDPEARWPSLSEVFMRLARLESEAVVLAKNCYREWCFQKLAFYQSFYTRFFEKCPELRPLFASRDMDAQCRLLDAAVQGLLNFPGIPMAEPTVLSITRARHRPLGLQPHHFDAFGAALHETLRALPQISEETLRGWDYTLAPGLAYMKEHDPA